MRDLALGKGAKFDRRADAGKPPAIHFESSFFLRALILFFKNVFIDGASSNAVEASHSHSKPNRQRSRRPQLNSYKPQPLAAPHRTAQPISQPPV
jgi:hypothetical protein